MAWARLSSLPQGGVEQTMSTDHPPFREGSVPRSICHRAPSAAVAAVVTTAVLLAAPIAQAGRRPDPRPAKAKRACAAGQVERGVAILAELLVDRGDVNAIYNQGRCYQQNGRAELAIARFREYLRVARAVSPAERAEVTGFITELESELERKARRSASAESSPANGAPDRTDLAASASASPAAAKHENPATPVERADGRGEGSADRGMAKAQPDATFGPSTGVPGSEPFVGAGLPPADEVGTRPLRIAAYSSAAVGLTALAVGGYFAVQTRAAARDVERLSGTVDPHRVYDMMMRGRRAETWQWIGFGTGAAALGTAVGLWVWDGLSASPIVVSGHGVSAQVGGRF